MKSSRRLWIVALIAVLVLTADGQSSAGTPSEPGGFKSTGAGVVSGATWEYPTVGSAKRAYQDVRIGAPRTGAKSVDLDYHRGTGNIFAAVAWGDGWSMNISTNGGATWEETYFFGAESGIGMKVGGDFAWVAYASSATPTQLRIRRFSAATGLVDATYNYQLIDNVHPATIVDVAMTSNADDSDTGIYIVCVTSDGAVKFYWDDLIGTTFDSYHPSITDADGNLDLAYNPGSQSGFFLFISYRVGVLVHVGRLHIFGGWDHFLLSLSDGNNGYTAISAYNDTVTTAFEFDTTYGNAVRQFTNTDSGTGTWTVESVFYPVTSGSPEAAGVDISLRSPHGSTVAFQLEEGAFDGAYYRHLQGHGSGSWGSHIGINEVDSAAQTQATVEWLGAGCVSSYGVVYLSGADWAPYFDLITPRAFFCDGFESGSTSAWN